MVGRDRVQLLLWGGGESTVLGVGKLRGRKARRISHISVWFLLLYFPLGGFGVDQLQGKRRKSSRLSVLTCPLSTLSGWWFWVIAWPLPHLSLTVCQLRFLMHVHHPHSYVTHARACARTHARTQAQTRTHFSLSPCLSVSVSVSLSVCLPLLPWTFRDQYLCGGSEGRKGEHRGRPSAPVGDTPRKSSRPVPDTSPGGALDCVSEQPAGHGPP